MTKPASLKWVWVKTYQVRRLTDEGLLVPYRSEYGPVPCCEYGYDTEEEAVEAIERHNHREASIIAVMRQRPK